MDAEEDRRRRIRTASTGVILAIKRARFAEPARRPATTSLDVYVAVLDHGVRSSAGFEKYLTRRATR